MNVVPNSSVEMMTARTKCHWTKFHSENELVFIQIKLIKVSLYNSKYLSLYASILKNAIDIPKKKYKYTYKSPQHEQ